MGEAKVRPIFALRIPSALRSGERDVQFLVDVFMCWIVTLGIELDAQSSQRLTTESFDCPTAVQIRYYWDDNLTAPDASHISQHNLNEILCAWSIKSFQRRAAIKAIVASDG